MRLFQLTSAASLCLILGACAVSTPGSQAPAKGQQDCVNASARRFQQPPGNFVVEGSGVGMAAEVYEVRLRNTSTGRPIKCTVDENGNVTGVVELR